MPFIELEESPLNPNQHPISIYYREYGDNTKLPLIFLHGGWGYGIYPFDRQIEVFANRFQILIPDRSGYGQSTRLNNFPTDFHQQAAGEMFNFLDALKIERAILWGHSDGAVIAAIMGLRQPTRFVGLIMEACHYHRKKPASREFFQSMVDDPAVFGERVCEILAREHGEDYWKKLMAMDGNAWLQIAAESDDPTRDLYQNRFAELSVPSLFIHGSADPRTEPGEIETVQQLLPNARIDMITDAGHSPHSHKASAAESNRLATIFFDELNA